MAQGETYEEFVEKFKPKRTTDDCFTPPEVYDAVLNWAIKEYGIGDRTIVRPFWPGGDYETVEYPEGCVVVDNPPFSILAKIIRFYEEKGIKFFLFCPYTTAFSLAASECCSVLVANASVTYENGAVVGTCFCTNLEDYRFRSCPELYETLKAVEEKRRKETKKQLPKYSYPENLCTATMVGYLSKNGVDFRVSRKDSYRIGTLDAQRPLRKSIFGDGYLLSEKAAAEKAAAEKAAAEKAAAYRFELSEREWEIVKGLGK